MADSTPNETQESAHVAPFGGQRLFELASVSKVRWDTFDSEERGSAALYAWGLYEIWLEHGDTGAYDLELDLLPVLRLAWADTACRSLMQSRMQFWAPSRRDTFATMMAGGGPSAAALVAFRPSSDWRNEPQPAPVIWRDHDAEYADAVLSVGEVAVLAGAGKGGKSYLCIALAKAAAEAANPGYGQACGLRVAAGPVVILSYEDSPKRIDMRAASMGAPASAVLVTANPAPLYGMDRQTRTWQPLEAWRPTWDGIAACKPGLVVIDTGPKAMHGETLDPAAIIGFLQEIEREARQGAFGVLVTAHDTKAARDSARRGDTVDAGVIAGSAQWHDSPRGVLHLTKEGAGDSPRILEAVKCSYGRDGWGARLEVFYNDKGQYAGLQLQDLLDEAGIAEAREVLKTGTTSGQTTRSARNGSGKGRLADPASPPR